MQDWKDALAALGGTLPPGEEAAGTPDTHEQDAAVQREPLHVVVERKGRGGKTATIIEGFTCGDSALADVARELRRHLGAGGSSRCGEILIQGDHRAKTIGWLHAHGYRTKG